MAISCIVSEIKQDITQKSRFFHTSLLRKSPLGKTDANNFTLFFLQPSQLHGLSDGVDRFCK